MLSRIRWRLPLLLVLSAAGVGPVRALARSAVDALGPAAHASRLRVVWGALVLGVVVALLLRRRLEWLAVFAHEQAHALAALTLLRPVTGFRASGRSGGLVTYRGAPSLWIAGAPYALPLLALAVVAASLVTAGFARPAPVLGAAIGASIGVHLALAAQHLARNASDVRAGGDANDFAPFGRPATLLHIVLVNVALLGTLVAFAAGGGRGVADFWRASARHDLRAARELLAR
jgi:hypothetical protein